MSAQLFKIVSPCPRHSSASASACHRQWVDNLQPVEITSELMLQPFFSRLDDGSDILILNVRTPRKVFQTEPTPGQWLRLGPYVELDLLILAVRYHTNGKPASVLIEFALQTSALEFLK